jgi:hypothetical protein
MEWAEGMNEERHQDMRINGSELEVNTGDEDVWGRREVSNFGMAYSPIGTSRLHHPHDIPIAVKCS